MKVYRCFYEGQMQPAFQEQCLASLKQREMALQQLAEEGKLMTLCVYVYGVHLYVYYEALGEERKPEELFQGSEAYLVPYPGKDQLRFWAERTDVFHFNIPIDAEDWKRPQLPQKRRGSIAMLRPECISRYIFFHYGLQEERNFLGDKYEIISLRDNLLFGYFELPRLIETPSVPGQLYTGVMEQVWQDARMGENFYKWPDTNEYWKDLDSILEIYPSGN